MFDKETSATMKLAKNQRLFKENIIVFPEDEKKEPYLAATKCPKCGKVYFPQKNFCPLCVYDEGMEEIALSNEGKLYTSSTVYLGVKGFKTPYVLGWVEFPEEKIRIAAQIDIEPEQAAEKLKPGQEVRLNIGKLRTLDDGTEIIGYRYKPVI
jgi:uncharacterized OB-fold protein